MQPIPWINFGMQSKPVKTKKHLLMMGLVMKVVCSGSLFGSVCFGFMVATNGAYIDNGSRDPKGKPYNIDVLDFLPIGEKLTHQSGANHVKKPNMHSNLMMSLARVPRVLNEDSLTKLKLRPQNLRLIGIQALRTFFSEHVIPYMQAHPEIYAQLRMPQILKKLHPDSTVDFTALFPPVSDVVVAMPVNGASSTMQGTPGNKEMKLADLQAENGLPQVFTSRLMS